MSSPRGPGARLRRGVFLGVVVGLVAGLLVAAVGSPAGAAPSRPGRPAGAGAAPARRVLVLSLPYVSWADLDRVPLPNLDRLIAASAIADLTTRADQRRTRLGDGYVTFGAGSRAVADVTTDGEGFAVDERVGGFTAGEVFRRRTGRVPGRGLVHLGVSPIVQRNDKLLYDATIGALGDELRDAGFNRAVIANGDGLDLDTPILSRASGRRRAAVLGLMGSAGRVPAGRVDDGLLVRDRRAPFGRRLDHAAVLEAFDRVWRDRTVALVEASDLVRADLYRPFEAPSQRDAQLVRALRRTDRLVGALLQRVDPRRDAVVVFGPAHSTRTITLTPLAVRASGVEPGLLRTGTTRRSGFVQLIDVAPTILDLVGLPRPSSMEGRPAEVGRRGGSADDRRDFLVEADAAAQFRDDLVGQVVVALVVFALMLALGAVYALSSPARATARRVLAFGALAVLGFVPAVYLARLFPLHEAGAVAYWAFVVGVAMLLAMVAHLAGRRVLLDSLLVALFVTVGLLVLDVMRGAPLMFNSALGYSPTVAGRFAGFGNPAYAALACSALLGSVLVAHRIGGRRGAWTAIAILGAVVIFDGAPFWGSDVGGILSMVPAYAITAFLLLGWRLRWRTVAWALVGLVVAAVGFTLLDLARPPGRRTHLGRLVERVQDRGWGDFLVVVQRKLADNLASVTRSVWGLVIPIVLLLLWWLARRARARLDIVAAAIPEWRIAAIGFAVLATLGWAMNDSGIAIPGMMLQILNAVIVWLVVRVPDALGDVPPEPGLDRPATSAPAAGSRPEPVSAG